MNYLFCAHNDVRNGFDILLVNDTIARCVGVCSVDGFGIVIDEDLNHHDVGNVDLLVVVGVAPESLRGLEGGGSGW